ncbi:MAG: hypothetical protein QM778_28520 [Myxococcales bacterium]
MASGSLRRVCWALTSCALVACGDSTNTGNHGSELDSGSQTEDSGTSSGDGDGDGDGELDARIPDGDDGGAADDSGVPGDGGSHGSDAGDAGDAGDESDFVSFLAIGDTRYEQTASIASPDGFDPFVSVTHRRADYPPYGIAMAQASWTADDGYRDLAYVRVYTDGGPSMSGTYTVSGADSHGNAEVFIHDGEPGTTERQCSGTSGTVTVTDGGLGHKAVATYTVTAWHASKGTCPATPTTGSFEIAHESDDLTGNSGTQGDWFKIDDVTYTEGSEILYSPRVYARHYGTGHTLIVSMEAGIDVDGPGDDWQQIELYVYAGGDTSGGTYPTGKSEGGSLITYQSSVASTCLAPVATDGLVELDPYGDVGTVITGSITIDKWNYGTNCPATPWTVPFSATREADE